MMNNLLACLDIYKIIILNGYIQKEYTERAKKVLEEINQLENLINKREILNSYDFKTLKRDVACLFHPDRFKSIPGIIDNVDDTLGIFNGAINRITEDIKKGYTFRGEPKWDSYRYEKRNYSETNTNQANYEDENNETIITYISRRFNALFRNIPSNENDYDAIIQKYNKKINKLKEQLENAEFDIEIIKRRINNNTVERYQATSPKKINEHYKVLCNKLYNRAKKDKEEKDKKKQSLNSRYYELTPLMYAKEQEWNYRYTALLREHEQLTKDYEKAVSLNDKKQMRVLTKKLNDVNVEIATEAKILEVGFQKAISEEVILNDYSYQELLKKFKEAEKRFREADSRYKRTLNNPDIAREEIRRSIEEKYSNKARKYSEDLINAENKRNTLNGELESTLEELKQFKRKYSKYSPKKKTR